MKLVRQFEELIADYYNAPYAVATDSCTHAIELCLRFQKLQHTSCPKHTYLSIPMTFEKLNLNWAFVDKQWEKYYFIGNSNIVDAAVHWQEDGYIPGTLMCLSFQFKKHLGLSRGGMILVDNDEDYVKLKKMSYDGRSPDIPWAEQDVDMLGYHYYMTPETAMLGIQRFYEVKDTPPRQWSYKDYPDISELKVFDHVK